MKKSINLVLKKLLEFDHNYISAKLQFTETNSSSTLSLDLTKKTVEVLNTLSMLDEDDSKQYFITIAALLWEYHNPKYTGIKDIIVVLLSKIGYSPSSIVLDDNNEKNIPCVSSLISQIESDANQLLYELKIEECNYILTNFQYSLWRALDSSTVGVSAPTSAGKSFILLLKSAEWVIKNQYDIIYIVPTLSLVNQVTADFVNIFKKVKYANYKIRNSYIKDKSNVPYIYIMTQEKVLASFSANNNPFDKEAVLIVDEIQNIERIDEESNELRSKILYDIINEFRYQKNIVKRIISGPRINNIANVAKELFGKESTTCVSTDVSPVLNITYSVRKKGNEYFFNQYCELDKKAASLKITKPELITGIRQKRYDTAFINYLISVIDSLGPCSKNIIFAPTSIQAKKIAVEISSTRQASGQEQLISLSDYLKSSVRENYELANTVTSGVIYHHGKLPAHVRKVIEQAAVDMLVNNIVCTTTLMQGVNLPAQNIIIRNPHLYTKTSAHSAELSSYEMANLRGRAGRLLKDFIGRTFVLDENEFLEFPEEYEQITLFENTKKELSTGYGDKFEQSRHQIIEAVENSLSATQHDEKYGYLIIYIRQCILRYGIKAKVRLKDVGITLTDMEFLQVQKSLDTITIDRSLCLKNRYWDPFVLDSLFKDMDLPKAPTGIAEKNISNKLRVILKYLRESDLYSSAFEKYIPASHRTGRMLTLLCDTTERWLKGISLSEILKDAYYDNSENIDKTIGLIQNTISFSIPVLLRPIYDIQKADSSFLNFIECGAYIKRIRVLIEAGVPRESAIYLYEKILKNANCNEDQDSIEYLKSILEKEIENIPYWIKVQINTLL